MSTAPRIPISFQTLEVPGSAEGAVKARCLTRRVTGRNPPARTGSRIWVRPEASDAGVRGTRGNLEDTANLATGIDGGSISHHVSRRCPGIAFSSGPGERMGTHGAGIQGETVTPKAYH